MSLCNSGSCSSRSSASAKLTALLQDIEMPLVAVLADMEWTGIPIDREWFARLRERFQRTD